MALGLLSGDEDHQVTVAYMGRGVRCALKGVDVSYTMGMLDTLRKKMPEGRFLVEKESLQAERISEGELGPSFAVVNRKRLHEIISDADVTLSF